ncbi:MAG TPA: D-alanyl-D-alanine carboxypeptidase [Solirubrobacteraceae bacterium]|nr:D-alanyl-D-alanine carboxypeptidase [Solirubrobacteraceae bacterium]
MRRPAHGRGVRIRVTGVVAAGAAAFSLAGCGGQASFTTTVRQRITIVHKRATEGAATPAERAQRSPTLLRLARALDRQFKLAGRVSGAYVFDLTTDRQLYALRAGVKRPPASVEKLFTTVALLNDLGPSARLRTGVYGTGHLGAGGVWHGNLYLRGGGDPTFGDGTFNRIWEQGYGPTASQLALQLAHHGIQRVTGQLIGDASLFDALRGPPSSNYQPDIPDLGGQLSALTFDHGATLAAAVTRNTGPVTTPHRTAPPLTPGALAARELALTLKSLHVAVTASTRTATTPARAHRLATVSSPPISVMLRLMDVPSDDFFAEMLTKQLGVKVMGSGTTKSGAYVISSALRSYHLHPQIVDGSGLSRRDLASPLEVVDLLRYIDHTVTGATLAASLPTVGVSGTTRTIAVHTAAAGRCVGKTGTLDNVSNLAGYCHARGRQLVAYALFVDGPPNWTALTLIGRMVAAIATY